MTIKLNATNLKNLIEKMRAADENLILEATGHRYSALAEFGRIHFGEFFARIHLEDEEHILEANWTPDVTAKDVNGVHFEKEEVMTILMLNSPHH
jgi:hypothetical protein